jgi:hypothetical protein
MGFLDDAFGETVAEFETALNERAKELARAFLAPPYRKERAASHP